MNDTALQARLDQLRATGAQRWLLAAVAIVAATLAARHGSPTGTRHGWSWWSSSVPPWRQRSRLARRLRRDRDRDARWALAVDGTTPWALAVAIGLLMFHTVIALMAVTPPTANIDRRLLQRCSAVPAGSFATTVVWTLATTLQRQQLAGTAPLTFAALAALTIAIVAALLGTQD